MQFSIADNLDAENVAQNQSMNREVKQPNMPGQPSGQQTVSLRDGTVAEDDAFWDFVKSIRANSAHPAIIQFMGQMAWYTRYTMLLPLISIMTRSKQIKKVALWSVTMNINCSSITINDNR